MSDNAWEAFTQRMRAVPKQASDWVSDLRDIPGRADAIAEDIYGNNSARDASAKNAFRHALGTGLLTQKLGGGWVAGTVAKLAGWGWEAPTLLDPRSSDAARDDSRHDLNANALGAYLATQKGSQAELVNALRGYAARSVVEPAPGAFARPVGYLTRTQR